MSFLNKHTSNSPPSPCLGALLIWGEKWRGGVRKGSARHSHTLCPASAHPRGGAGVWQRVKTEKSFPRARFLQIARLFPAIRNQRSRHYNQNPRREGGVNKPLTIFAGVGLVLSLDIWGPNLHRNPSGKTARPRVVPSLNSPTVRFNTTILRLHPEDGGAGGKTGRGRRESIAGVVGSSRVASLVVATAVARRTVAVRLHHHPLPPIPRAEQV